MKLPDAPVKRFIGRSFGKRWLAIVSVFTLMAGLIVVPNAAAAPTIAALTMSPQSQTVDPGSTANVSVSLYSLLSGVGGVNIRYTITGANTTSGTVTTNASGNATISYAGTHSGTDTVSAYADLNNNSSHDSNEPSASATVYWTISNGSLTLSPSSQAATPGSNVSLTAQLTAPGSNVNGVTIRYTVSGQNSRSGSVTTNASGNATITYTGSVYGTDTVRAYADFDNNGSQGTGEPGASATVVWGSSNLSLSPSTQTALIKTQASLTATYFNASGSSAGATIRYTVTGANSTSGSATTDANGKATITYTGSNTGNDTVSAYVDVNNNSSQGSDEPSATATVTWTSTATLSLQPAAASVGQGTSAYVAVSLTTSGSGIAGVPIRYSATGANPASGSMTTDGNGNTVITLNDGSAGTDTVTAYADLNNNSTQDTGEPTASTSVTWTSSSTQPTPPPSTFQPAQTASPKTGCMYFAATGHNLCAGFLAYWNHFGGLGIFGMPLTEEFQLNGVTTQFFERAEFQWFPGAWPSHYDVELGLLGNQVTAGRGSETPFEAAQPNSSNGCTYYSATGHNLCGNFASFWQQNGGLATFGYPISEPFQEKNPDTGQTYTVQYFQRARFEMHPNQTSNFGIQLGRLGAQVLQMQFGVNP